MLDLYVSSFCPIQAVKSKDIITLIAGFTVSSLPAYYSGTAGEMSGYIKLLGCVLSKAQPVRFKEGTTSSTGAEQTSILAERV